MNLKIYKKGQAQYTRLGSGAAVMVIVGFGCWRLYQILEGLAIANQSTKLWVQTLVPVILFGAIGFLVYWILNKVIVADFMINAEGEIKKVNWSSRQEIIASTYIVIIAVVFFACFLGGADVFFQILFRGIGLLPS
jgi:preprotein translocase SecE subunit